MEPTTRQPQRLVFLDGLRGIAALFVVSFHTASAFEPAATVGGTAPVHSPIDHVLRWTPILGLPFKGNFAVCVFFVLSGIALSLGPLRRLNSGRPVRASVLCAVVRRAPRLMIPALGATAIAGVLWATGAYGNVAAGPLSSSPWFAGFWKGSPVWWGPLREATAGIIFSSVPHVYVPVLWTMRWELVGSLLVFGVFLLSPPRRVRLLACALGAVLFWQSYLFCFVAGVAIAELSPMLSGRTARPRRAAASVRMRWWIFAPLGIYGLVLGSCPSPAPNAFYRSLVPGDWRDDIIQSHMLGATLLLAAVVALVPVQNALSTAPCRFLGRVSFSLYLLHFLVLGSAGAATFTALYGHVPYVVASGSALAVTVAAALFAAYLFTIAVDEPAVRWLARLNAPLQRVLDRRRPALTERPTAAAAPEPAATGAPQ